MYSYLKTVNFICIVNQVCKEKQIYFGQLSQRMFEKSHSYNPISQIAVYFAERFLKHVLKKYIKEGVENVKEEF